MSPAPPGPIGVWAHLDTLAISGARAFAHRVDELGFGALWVPETVGREPFTLLGLLAAQTSRLTLGTSIASIWGHDAQQVRMAAATLHEATDGRFILGLGVSHPHLAARLRGHTFDRPLARMRAYLAAYRSAVYRGPTPSEADGGPPVLLAALRRRMTDLAATDADGAFAYLVTPAHVAWMRQRLDAAAPNEGRRPLLAVSLAVALTDAGVDAASARAYLAPYLRTPTYRASWALQGFEPPDWGPPGSDRLVEAMVAIGSVADIRGRVDALHRAGADHVAIIALAPDGSTEHLEAVEALAP